MITPIGINCNFWLLVYFWWWKLHGGTVVGVGEIVSYKYDIFISSSSSMLQNKYSNSKNLIQISRHLFFNSLDRIRTNERHPPTLSIQSDINWLLVITSHLYRNNVSNVNKLDFYLCFIFMFHNSKLCHAR